MQIKSTTSLSCGNFQKKSCQLKMVTFTILLNSANKGAGI